MLVQRKGRLDSQSTRLKAERKDAAAYQEQEGDSWYEWFLERKVVVGISVLAGAAAVGAIAWKVRR